MTTTLILGGVKSGKSVLAEAVAHKSAMTVTYIATASGQDDEMQYRIQTHQRRRPKQWQTVETPLHLASAIQQHCVEKHCVLVDCLTLWLTNLLMQENETLLRREIDALVDCINQLEGTLIMVSNETNMGITPLGELTRRYCDEVGVLHQRIAQKCDNVVLTVAGLPHILKGHLHD
ncbi:MAG: bifunctional adenosylcobinamide kinase/adenosylcobinamide-phosphate guanylyltransferase [Piscirickettsiaceae bacterium]|nr:bifunctional adenosylcobinamide kinase/adenosylcobinamide-phosphate guanylyltransferase [Piscirickettsiaceae bacterium]